MRWVIAAAGMGLMAVLGTVASWSLFAQPLAAAFGWSSATTTWTFATAIFFVGIGAIIGGRLQDLLGPRPIALAGVVLWAVGNLLAGLGTVRLGAPWLYATYGVLGGFGLGLAYVTPVAAVTKWFADRRGLGSGLVVMGFGLGAFFYSLVLRSVPSFTAATEQAGAVLAARAAGLPAALSRPAVDAVMRTFIVSGIAFAIVGLGCAALLRNPPALARSGGAPHGPSDGASWPPGCALRTPQFWALWAMLFLNACAGILFISNAVPIMRELTGADAQSAAAVYGVLAIFNGLGRLFWGAVSDRIGPRLAYALLYGTQIGVFALIGRLHTLSAVAPLFALLLLCYGGGFGTMPSLVADWFGTRTLGVNYGWILSAWGVAGVAGPIFVAAVKDQTGSYSGALPVMSGVLAIAVLLPLFTRKPTPPTPPKPTPPTPPTTRERESRATTLPWR